MFPPQKKWEKKKNYLEKYWNICNHEIMYQMEVSFPGFLGDKYIHWNCVLPMSLCTGSPWTEKDGKALKSRGDVSLVSPISKLFLKPWH